MAIKNVFEWTDVLAFGSEKGNGFEYSWNQLHGILVDDEFCPMYECYTRDYHISEFSYDKEEDECFGDYGMSKETCDVVTAFMNSKGITEMLITR